MVKSLTLKSLALVTLISPTFVFATEVQQETFDVGLESGQDIKRSFRFTMVNDNPFLNLFPDLFYTEDDSGYTHGVGLATSYLMKKGYFSPNERWNVKLDTNLYTKNLTPEGQDLFPNVPQAFNEITTIKVERDDVFNSIETGKPYYVVGAGIGLMNDKDEKGFMAVGQQTAWHDYKHHNLTPDTTPLYDNQPGNTYDGFLSAKAAVGKVITFNDQMKDCQCEIDLIKVEGGTELISLRKGSNVYFMVEADKSLLKFGKNSIGIKGSVKGVAHENGDEELQSFTGIRFDRPNLNIETGFTHREGNYNKDFVSYDDKDSIWSLSVEYKWGKKGKKKN